MDTNSTSCGSPDYRRPPGLQLVAWFLDMNMSSSGRPYHKYSCESQVFKMVLGSSMDHRYQYRLQIPMDYGGLSRRSNTVNELFFISDILSLLKVGTVVSLLKVCENSRLLKTPCPHQPFLATCFLMPSLTPVTTVVTLVLPLPTTYAPLCPSIFPTDSSHICSLWH